MKEILTAEAEARKKELKTLASAYLVRFEKELADFVAKGEPDMAELVELAWRNMIIGRIMSPIKEEYEARLELGKDIWKGNADEPEFFARIFVSLAQAQEAAKRNWTASGQGLTAGAVYQTTRDLLMADRELIQKLFPSCFVSPPESLDVLMAGELMAKAQSEFAKVEPEKELKLIPWGAIGFYKNIPVSVERYSTDGLVSLKPLRHEDFGDFADKIGLQGVSILALKPDNFELPKAPDHLEGNFETFSGSRGVVASAYKVYQILEAHGIKYDRSEVIDKLRVLGESYPDGGLKIRLVYADKEVRFEVKK